MKRMDRVNELIKRELGSVFEKVICPDTDALVTVTQVNTSADLREAEVYVSIFGSDTQKIDTFRMIKKKRRDLQQATFQHITLKYTPHLTFKLDDKLEKADQLFQILNEIEEDKDEDS